MAFFGQMADVIEWQPDNDRILFFKFKNREIKKGSKLIIHPGQDAIFLYNGKIEGIFRDEGRYDVESQIIPFLSTLKGFKFGFNSGLRAEVLFINTREITDKWGTKNPINLPAQGLPGGMPIRAYGTFSCKVSDYQVLIDKIAGIRETYSLDDVRERIMGNLDQLLMKHIAAEGKDMFHLQTSAAEIGSGIRSDLDYQMEKIGIAITDFTIANVSYPEEIQNMAQKVAAQSMIGGNMNTYQQVAFADSMRDGRSAGSMAGNMAGIMAGMTMGKRMADQLTPETSADHSAPQTSATQAAAPNSNDSMNAGKAPNFCPNCGQKITSGRFCPNCGQKLY
ncbi:MAG: SPFH domain-containing protein [Bilifractor sp.]